VATLQLETSTGAGEPVACPRTETIRSQGGWLEFESFFARYEQPLCGYLRRMVPCNEAALDLAQEAFLRTWQHFAELQTYDRPEAWLYRVATNLAISYLRRKKSLCFADVYQHSVGDSEFEEAAFDSQYLADPLDVEQEIADRIAIERTLEQLAQRQRATLLLRTVYGMSCQEIAGTLGISVANVRQTLTRGRERFRKLYLSAS
jgi:RNA polymerase sigma-70 factor, ECF subfamily